MSVWDTRDETSGGVVVHIGSDTQSYDSVTADMVKDIAREEGISKFIVKNDSRQLNPADFPVRSGNIYISEYNEAA